MLTKLVLTALGITLGLIITRILDHHEIHKLKEHVIELEEENNKLVACNSKLVEENIRINAQLKHMLQTPPSQENIPKFDD